MKRWLLICTAFPVLAFAQGRSGVLFLDTVGHPHEQYVRILQERGIVQGYGYGLFRPDILVNRAEFLKILMLARFGSQVYQTADRRCFADFVDNEEWYWLHACSAKDARIVSGYPDGTFRGGEPVNLAEALKLSVLAWDLPLPVYFRTPDHWYDPYVDAAVTRGIFDYFQKNPGHLLTRSEMAYLIVSLGEEIAMVGSRSSSSPSSSRNVASRQTSSRSWGICGNGVVDAGEQCDDGNAVDGDGCSSICIIVGNPVRHGALLVEQRTLGSVAIAAGTRDVPLLAFDATASRQDVWITDLTLRAASGSLNSATNYRLFVDLDGDGTVDRAIATGSARGSRIAFSTFQIRVSNGTALRMEVRADLSINASGADLAVGFAKDDAAFIAAVGARDGEDLSGIALENDDCPVDICWIRVRTLTESVISLKTVGNLSVVADSTPLTSKLLLLGERSDAVMRVVLLARDEDIIVERFGVDGVPTSVDRLEFYDPGAAEPFVTARSGGCSVLIVGRMCTSIPFTVKRDVPRRLLMRAILKSDAEGGGSETTLSLSVSESSGTPHALEARGAQSGAELSQNDGDAAGEGEIFVGAAFTGGNVAITGSTHDIVHSKIGSIDNAHADADDSPIPVGSATLGSFRFTALQNRNSRNGFNDVVVRTLVFRVTASNVEVDVNAFRLYNVLDASVSTPCSANRSMLDITVTCEAIADALASVVSPGRSVTLALRGSVTDPQVLSGGSSLQVRLASLSDRSTLGVVDWHDGVRLLQWVELPVTTVRSTLYRTR
ncbi:hypothetical protein FJZ27_02765 [Candidatus Peribacteria bacterium]|nr:hypothetical protein [Candidatus Peribacteria bacterium]